ncbi:MAG: hypothetical protein ACRD2Y_10685 [Terriglobales bacterium]
MRIADGVRYVHLHVELAKDGKLRRRFLYSRPEHQIEVWRCNDERAEPARVVCTAEDGSGTCVGWEINGQNGCFRKALDTANSAWSFTFVEDLGFQVTLVPAP